MSQTLNKEGKNQKQYTFKVALAVVAGQVGCVTILLVVGALGAGLWLDRQFGTNPLFLIILLLASAPLTVVIMLWIVRSVTARMKTMNQTETTETETLEEANRGTDPR